MELPFWSHRWRTARSHWPSIPHTLHICRYLDGVPNGSAGGPFSVGLRERRWHACLSKRLLDPVEGLAASEVRLREGGVAWPWPWSWRLLLQPLWLGISHRVHDWWRNGDRRHEVLRQLLKDEKKQVKAAKEAKEKEAFPKLTEGETERTRLHFLAEYFLIWNSMQNPRVKHRSRPTVLSWVGTTLRSSPCPLRLPTTCIFICMCAHTPHDNKARFQSSLGSCHLALEAVDEVSDCY